jgi:translocation and assembly module TamB
LLFGPSATTISPIQAVQLAASLNALRGDGTDPVGKVEKAIKLDRLSVYAADPTLGRGTAVGAGKYINSRVYVELTTDAKGYAATQLEVALTKAFRLLSQVGTTLGGTSINLQYTKRY